MRHNFVTKRDIESFEHISDGQLSVLGVVTTLIGQDNALILAPLEVRIR